MEALSLNILFISFVREYSNITTENVLSSIKSLDAEADELCSLVRDREVLLVDL